MRRLFLLLVVLVLGTSLAFVQLQTTHAGNEPHWVNDLTYGSKGGGFYWDPSSHQVWTSERGWHTFSPNPPRTITPLWVNDLNYGSLGGGFYLDPATNEVWTSERGWHTFSPLPQETKIAIVEQGFVSYANGTGGFFVPWVAILGNSSSNQAIQNVMVSATFYDGQNAVLGTSVGFAEVIFPGETTAVGAPGSQLPTRPARMELSLSQGNIVLVSGGSDFKASGITLVDQTTQWAVTATITNPFDRGLHQLQISCVVYRGSAIVGIGHDFKIDLAGGASQLTTCPIDRREDLTGATREAFYVNYSPLTFIDK
jgi:hypothetical protein